MKEAELKCSSVARPQGLNCTPFDYDFLGIRLWGGREGDRGREREKRGEREERGKERHSRGEELVST